ncbi:MAG: tRNA (adenosine(37)-N6)-dimethylallyltransferase MiaA [Ferruginibacter sp.]
MSIKKTCIIITGPTAVGKTAIALQLAKHFSTRIISADSRQCYKELNIGVAKPSIQELQSAIHYFINSHSIHETVNAAVFERYALQKASEIFVDHDIAVMVGGTGLYVKAFCSGMDPIPVISPGIRKEIVSKYEAGGLSWLQQELKEEDPVYFAAGESQNPHRLMRALEVKLSTGKSIVEFQKRTNTERNFSIIKIGLQLPRPELYERINQRVDAMIAEGLLEEVKALLPWQQLNALQTVGYKEIFDYYGQKTSFENAVESVKLNTRHYAKRQMTWFKKDAGIKWCAPYFDTVLETLQACLQP